MDVEMESPTLKKSRLFPLILTLFLILILASGAGIYYIYYNLQPVAGTGERRTEIPQGANGVTISRILEEEGIIRDDRIFRYYAQYKGVSSKFKAGTYLFSSGVTVDQILDKLVNGDVYLETVKFTIPEGFTIQQIADSLAEQGIVDKENFLQLVNEGDFNYPFVKEIPKDSTIKYRLEGYLFPNTYEMEKGSTEYEIIDRMLSEFQKQMKPEWIEAFRNKGLTLHQGLTLSSIVERETIVKKELPIVAGVFYNRLNDGWKMQSDATAQYASGNWKDRLYFKDLEISDPYNTFVVEGLPPGPISNPGTAALEATAFPQEHDYYFFVTKKDGTDEHYFTKTFEEHRAQDARSRNNNN